MNIRLFLALYLLFLPLLFVPMMTGAQEPREKITPVTQAEVIQPPTLGGTWQPIGPAPKRNGRSRGGKTGGEVGGAVHALAAHPIDANTLYVGAVNGGIWKTTNATAIRPTWVLQTESQLSLSIGALEFDPTDATHQTLVAGIGRFSSFGRRGGERLGLLRTVNGGDRWTRIDGGGVLVGKNISGVAPRGRTIVVSVNDADSPGLPPLGIFRSTDFGATFTSISSANGAMWGLPGGVTHDLAGDPANPARLFTGVVGADMVGGQNGVYRSTNTGANWTKVSNEEMDALIIRNITNNIEIAVGRENNVYVAIVNSSHLAGLFRSGDGGDTWTKLDVPNLHPVAQGHIHLSIVADPANANIAYIGGDHAVRSEFGATEGGGRLFRCDASLEPGSQCVHLTHSSLVGPPGGGTLNMTWPHGDSREMVFDANGDIIEADDGGVYRRTSPRTNQGDWFSISNNLQVFEFHSIAYDSNAKIVIGGAQDNGTASQSTPGATVWENESGGDGGDVAVDATSTPGLSIRYTSNQNFDFFRRRVYDADNVLQGVFRPALQLVGCEELLCKPEELPTYSFVTPIRLNAVAPRRLIIGAANTVYESFNQGATIRRLLDVTNLEIPVNSGGGHPIAYGATGNPDVLYIGSGDRVFVRTAPPPARLRQSSSYPGTGTGLLVVNLAGDPRNPLTACVIDLNTVYLTRDAGSNWINITGNLPSLNAGRLRSVAFVSNASGDAIVVGGNFGVFVALAGSGYKVWDRLGSGFPNALVFQLAYDSRDDILVAGTLGRGAWVLNHPTFSTTLFSSTFDALTDGFRFIPDAFGTNQPAYAAGSFVDQGGVSGGGLRVVVGGVDDAAVVGMSGGWRRSFHLSSQQAVSLSFDFNMTQTSEYESDEFSETLVRIDDKQIISVAKITGDGHGGTPISTGPTSHTVDLGCLPAGTRAVTIGVRNNKKTLATQSTGLLVDNVVVRANGPCLIP
jgi:photosystem II stability/assembly factor-like uncharacterized protein